MRRTSYLIVAAGFAVPGSLLLICGCETISSNQKKCEAGDACQAFEKQSPFDGGTTPECKGTPDTNPIFFSETCGVYVSPNGKDSDSSGSKSSGSKKNPFKSINVAIKHAADVYKTRVYLCSTTDFNEQIDFNDQIKIDKTIAATEIYGGFNCSVGSDWVKDPMSITTIHGPGVGFIIDTPGSVLLQDVSITSTSDKNNPGSSSIALLVSQATLTYTHGTLQADNGVNGTSEITLSADPALDALPGINGTDFCAAGSMHPGGAAQKKDCSMLTGGISQSGKGGDGGTVAGTVLNPGGNGGAGLPQNTSNGLPGAGETATTSCKNGLNGAAGAPGDRGPGGKGPGELTTSGYQGEPGQPGVAGTPGQGGGGGGGARGAHNVMACGNSFFSDFIGAGGGSGSTGSCGGRGGKGGGPGGSSIALVSLNAQQVTLTDVLLTVGVGGAGGNGADGQAGGAVNTAIGLGGQPGAGTSACSGGIGGKGGKGGAGGGGQGGHAVGIAYKGVKPEGSFMVSGDHLAGPGGAAGDNAPEGQGDPGASDDMLEFN